MNTAIFQEMSNLYHILEPIFGLFQKIVLGCSLRSSFIDPFSFAKKRATRFWRLFLSVLWSITFPFFLSRFFFLVLSWFFITSDWVLNQLHICIAYKLNFQWKRNELQHRRLERGVSKYGCLKNEYSRALNASYTFQLLMSFCIYLIIGYD